MTELCRMGLKAGQAFSLRMAAQIAHASFQKAGSSQSHRQSDCSRLALEQSHLVHLAVQAVIWLST